MKMEWRLSQLKSSTVVFYWAKFFGLAPVRIANNRFCQASLLDKLYAIILIVVYLLVMPTTLSHKLENHENENSALVLKKSITVVQTLIGLVSFVSNLIWFVWTSEKIVELMDDLCAIDTDLKDFGIVEDAENYLKNFLKLTMSGNILISTIHIAIHISDPDVPFVSTITQLFKDLNTLGVVLIFSNILIYIRQRFALLDERLCNCFGDLRETNFEGIKKARALHSKLWDLVDLTTELFSIPILLCIVRFSYMLISFSYLGASTLLDPNQGPSVEEYRILFIGRHFLYPILMLLMSIVELFIFLHASVTTCDQGNAAKVTLFRVWNKFQLSEIKNEFLLFTAHLTHKPVPAVTVFGLIALDYACLLKIFGVTIAYLIVMIQIEAS